MRFEVAPNPVVQPMRALRRSPQFGRPRQLFPAADAGRSAA